MDKTRSSASKTKVLFVIESLQCGGAEKSLVTLLQNISHNAALQISILRTNPNGEFEKFVPQAVEKINLDLYKNLSKWQLLRSRLYFLILRKLNRFRKLHTAHLYWKAYGKAIQNYPTEYDIAIAYNQGFATYFVATKIQASRKYAWLNTDYPKAGYRLHLDAVLYQKLNLTVCVSKENEASFRAEAQKLGLQLQSTVIKDITDPKWVVRLSKETIQDFPDANATTILTVGRLTKAKGIDLAIDACSILKAQHHAVKWFVIGDGPDRSLLEEQIRQKGLQNDFILLGYKENPYPYIRSCTIYAQTSLFEGLGLTLIEAALLHKPIVTTNFPTAASIVSHQKTAWICQMHPDAIATAIRTFIEDPNLSAQFVQNLKKQPHTDMQASLDKIHHLLTRKADSF